VTGSSGKTTTAAKLALWLVPPPPNTRMPLRTLTVPVLLKDTPPLLRSNAVVPALLVLVKLPLLLKMGSGAPPVIL
jgi:hypothetical protein